MDNCIPELGHVPQPYLIYYYKYNLNAWDFCSGSNLIYSTKHAKGNTEQQKIPNILKSKKL